MAPVRERSEKFGSYLQEEKLLSERLYHMLKKSAEMPPYWVFMPYLMERMIKGTVVMGGVCMWVGQVFPTGSKHYGKYITAPTTSVGGGRFPDMETVACKSQEVSGF